MNIRSAWASILVVLFLTQGCEECSDCAPRQMDPAIQVSFYADESLSEALTILDSLVAVLESDRSLLDTISVQYRDTLISAIELLVIDSAFFAERVDNFQDGNTLIDLLEGADMEPGSHFADTLINKDFLLPLNANSNKSVYYFQYLGITDTLALVYSRSIDQNLDGIRMQIFDLKIDESLTTFDNIGLRCKRSNCSNNNSVVEIYF